MYKLRK